MDNLHRKPMSSHGLIHNVTPENAGWRYVGI
jgi:5-deoxy-glucuronate isomerase